jgi:RNA-binding protein 5/10
LEHKTFKIEKSKVKISYCHPGVFVPVYTDSDKHSFKTASGNSIAYWDEQGYASEWTKDGKGPVPTDEEIEKFYNDIKGAVTAHTAGATIVQEPVLVSAPEPITDTSAKRELPSTDQQQQKKKRKVEPPSIKKPTAQIEKWASKREELRGQQTATPTTTTESPAIELSEFADTTQMCCLLCKRKFQSREEIQKHEKLSKLHKVLQLCS